MNPAISGVEAQPHGSDWPEITPVRKAPDMKPHPVICVTAAILLAAIARPSTASSPRAEIGQACRGSHCFDRSVSVNDTPFALVGTALYTYWGFEVYTAALYREQLEPGTQAEGTPPNLMLVLHYLRPVGAADIAKASRRVLGRLKLLDVPEIGAELSRFLPELSDVQANDEYRMILSGDGSLTLELNRKFIHRTEPGDFGRAYLEIWLAVGGLDDACREQLLGLKSGPYR